MIETYISLIVNRKDDIEIIECILREQKTESPIFILEYNDCFKINFANEYEYWELDNAIISALPDYEFTENLGKGRKEIRLQLSRVQSQLSTDNWGRPLENPIDETKYLIKKTEQKIVNFSPQIKVLYEEFNEFYYVNIIEGIDKANNEKGYLVLEEFKKYDKETDNGFLKNELYKTQIDAFDSGL